MPKQFPSEFLRDVVEVARSSGLTQAQVAHNFGISDTTVQRCVKQANIGGAYENAAITIDLELYKTECIRTEVLYADPYRTIADVKYATSG